MSNEQNINAAPIPPDGHDKAQEKLLAIIEKAPTPGWQRKIPATVNNNCNVIPINQNPNYGPPPLYSKYNDPNYRPYLSQDRSLKTSCAADTESEGTEYVVQDLLAEGELSATVGAPGSGKGQIICALVARVTQGESQLYGPDSIPTAPGIALFVSSEDDFKRVIRPRSEAAGANLGLIYSVDGICRNANDTTPFIYTAESEKSIIAWAERKNAEGKGKLRLVVFDPGFLALGGRACSNENVQEAFERLASLAKRLSCAILVVLHDTKLAKGKPPLARAGGPRAAVGVPRCVMLISEIVDGPSEYGGTHVLVRAKSNLGKIDGGYEFGFEPDVVPGKDGPVKTSKVVFKRYLPESPIYTLEWAEGGNDDGGIDALGFAINFLKQLLQNGPVLVSEAKRLTKAAGITMSNLTEAKIILGVKYRKQTGAGQFSPFEWYLPATDSK